MATAKSPTRGYTLDDIHTGLRALAWHNGQIATATRKLRAEQGWNIGEDTLRKWRNEHADVYAEKVDTLNGEELASKHEALIREELDFERDAIAVLHEKLLAGELDDKDMIAAVRNVAQSKGIAAEKIVNPLRGRPTQTATVNVGELLREMGRIAELARAPAPVAAIDSTAVEEK